MGCLVEGYGGVAPFAIDQNVLRVAFGGNERPWLESLPAPILARVRRHGRIPPAADTPEEIAPERHGGQVADAYLLSLDNAMTEEPALAVPGWRSPASLPRSSGWGARDSGAG